MNFAAKLALLIFSAVGTAAAGSFTPDALPPAALAQLTATPATYSYLKVTDLPLSAAAHTRDGDGYIGTLQVNDKSTFTPSIVLTETTVPEPATLVLFGSGLALAAIRRRRRVLSAKPRLLPLPETAQSRYAASYWPKSRIHLSFL